MESSLLRSAPLCGLLCALLASALGSPPAVASASELSATPEWTQVAQDVRAGSDTDLSLSTVATPSTVQVNQTVQIVHTIASNGSEGATNVAFETVLDPSFGAITAVPSTGSCSVFDLGAIVGTLVNCALGNLSPGGSATITINMTVSSLGEFMVTANIFLNETDSNTADNQKTITIEVVEEVVIPTADLRVSVSTLESTVVAGQLAVFRFSITNLGPDTTGFSFQTALPPSFSGLLAEFEQPSPTNSCIPPAGLLLVCTAGSLPPNSTVTIAASGQPNESGIFEVEGIVTGTLSDPVSTNNVDAVSLNVVPASADLSIELVASQARVSQGQDLDFTATARNAGPSLAIFVTVVINLPMSTDGGLAVEIISLPDECSRNSLVVTCNIGNLGVDRNEVLVIRSYAIWSGSIVAQASVTGDSPPDPVAANNTASTATLSRQPSTSGNNPESADGGDPVNMLTGEFIFDEPTDLTLSGPADISFERMYASLTGRDSTLAQPFGPNWTHNYNWRLIREDQFAQVVTPRGRTFSFRANGPSWTLVDPVDAGFTLVNHSGGLSFAQAQSGLVTVFDGSGLASEIHARGFQTSLTWAGGLLSSISDAFGNEILLQYSGGLISSVSDGAETTAFDYTSGLLTTVTYPGPVSLSYAYDPAHPVPGLLTTRETPSGASHTTQVYDAGGRVMRQTDALGAVTDITYGSDLTTIAYPNGSTATFDHDADGQLVEMTLPDGTSANLTNSDGQRTGSTDAGGTRNRTLDAASGLPTTMTSPGGRTVRVDYTTVTVAGSTQYLTNSVTWPDGTTSTYTYDASGRITHAALPGGAAFDYSYSSSGLLSSYDNPLGGQVAFAYNLNGTLASTQDETGSVTAFEYDARGNRTRTTFPDGASRAWVYDAVGRPATWLDENGATTQYEYDSNGNVTAITDPVGARTTFTYDAMDRPLTVTDAAGFSSQVSYDAMGNVVSSTDRSGGTTTFSYDAMGRLLSFTRPDGSRIAASRNAAGALTSLQFGSGETAQTAFGLDGLPTGATSAGGRTTSFTHNALGKLTGVIDAAGRATTVSRNAFGTISGISLPGGVSASYSVNPWGLVTGVTDPSGSIWTRTYDETGRLASWFSPSGREWSVTYNSRGQMGSVTGPSGTSTRSFDPAGRLTSETSPEGHSRTFSYDAAGRLTGSGTLQFTLDVRGSITAAGGYTGTRDPQERLGSFAWPGGQSIGYARDALGRLTSLTDWAGGVTRFTYVADGRLQSIERPNGVTTDYSRDSDGMILGISESLPSGSLASLSLQRDPLGNVTGADRLIPVEVIRAGRTTANTFDSDGRAAAFTYDPSGRRLSDGQRTYAWDEAGRLGSSGSAVFSYDEFGHQLSGPGGLIEVSYLHDVAVPVTERGSASIWRYVFTPGGHPMYRIADADSSRQFFHFDEAGNATILTDDSGTTIAAWMFDPYGRIIGKSGSVEDNPYLFAGAFGARALGVDGLYRMGVRVYDAETASFLSPEPMPDLMDPQALDPYTYAAQNPVRFVDPLGTMPQSTAQGSSLNSDIATGSGVVAAGASWFNTAANGFGRTGVRALVDVIEGRAPNGGLTTTLKNKAVRAAQEGARLSRAGNVRGATKALASAADLAKAANTVKSAGSAVGKVGDGAMILGVGLVALEGKGRFDDVGTRNGRTLDQAVDAYDTALQALGRSLKLKRITREQYRQRWRAIEKLKDARLEAAQSEFMTDIRIEATRFAIKGLEATLPIPIVSIGDAFQAVGAAINGTRVVK